MIFFNVSASSGVSGDNSHSNVCTLRSTPLNTKVAYGLIAVPDPALIPFAISGAIAPSPALARNKELSAANCSPSAIDPTSDTLSCSVSTPFENMPANLVLAPVKLSIDNAPPAASAVNEPSMPNSSEPTLTFKLSCRALGRGRTILDSPTSLACDDPPYEYSLKFKIIA